MRTFLSRINGSIELDNDYVTPLQRIHDEHIMDQAINNPTFSDADVILINYCRLYLQVTTISDMCTSDGATIDEALHSGELDSASSTSAWLHFTQGRPSTQAWILWRRLLTYWFDSEGMLHEPLGPWLLSANLLRRNWPTYHDAANDYLYVRSNTNSSTFRRYSRLTRASLYDDVTTVTWTPTATSTPASVNPSGTSWEMLDPGTTVPPKTQPPIPETFAEYITLLPPWEQSLFEGLDMPLDCYALLAAAKAINPADYDFKLHLISLSDGSAVNHSMSFGWVMSLPTAQRVATCSGPAPGSVQSSFRAEGYGLLSVTRFLYHLFRFCGVDPELKIQLSCDNDPLLRRVQSALPHTECFPNLTLEPDWDLVDSIVKTIQSMASSIILPHVKGHQDDDVAYIDLPLDAQLNCDADYEAVYHQSVYESYRPAVPRITTNKAQLHISGKTINTGYRTAISEAITTPALLDHICERNEWSPATLALFHEEAHSQALGRMVARHSQLVKLCHDIVPTAAITHRNNHLLPASCILCKHPSEDLDHLLRCNHVHRKPWGHSLYAAIRKTCSDNATLPFLIDILINGLDAWFTDTPLDKTRYPQKYHALIDNQASMGWRQIFQGRMCREWSRLQDRHLIDQQARNHTSSGLLWTTSIITTVWTSYFEMWDKRNKAVHGEDHKTRQIARRRKLAIELRHLHSQRDQALYTDHDIFIGDTPEDLEHYLDRTNVHHIENWLLIWKPVIVDSVKTAAALAISSVRPIREYFARLITPTPSRRPPKPRYDRRFHSLHDNHRVKRQRKRKPPPRNHSILAYFARQTKSTQHLQV
jgi:hypothetical protein